MDSVSAKPLCVAPPRQCLLEKSLSGFSTGKDMLEKFSATNVAIPFTVSDVVRCAEWKASSFHVLCAERGNPFHGNVRYVAIFSWLENVLGWRHCCPLRNDCGGAPFPSASGTASFRERGATYVHFWRRCAAEDSWWALAMHCSFATYSQSGVFPG